MDMMGSGFRVGIMEAEMETTFWGCRMLERGGS